MPWKTVGGTVNLTSRRLHVIWKRGRAKDGKSETPKEAEVNLDIRRGSWNFTKRWGRLPYPLYLAHEDL